MGRAMNKRNVLNSDHDEERIEKVDTEALFVDVSGWHNKSRNEADRCQLGIPAFERAFKIPAFERALKRRRISRKIWPEEDLIRVTFFSFFVLDWSRIRQKFLSSVSRIKAGSAKPFSHEELEESSTNQG